MSREDEIDELIMYVTDMRHSFTRKLDDQLYIIQEQNDRIRQQQRTIDEQKEVVDELAWQIRDLRDSVRRVKESVANGCLMGCQANNTIDNNKNQVTNNNETNGMQKTQSTSLPQAAPRRRGELVEDDIVISRDGRQQTGAISNETMYARISFGEFIEIDIILLYIGKVDVRSSTRCDSVCMEDGSRFSKCVLQVVLGYDLR